MITLPFSEGPAEDAAAPTLDRFEFQYCSAAARLLAALSQGRSCEIVCEWHEDYLVTSDAGVEAVSVKHREGHLPAWSLATLVSDGGLDHLLATFQRGDGVQCCFETNRAHVVDALWASDEHARRTARNDLARRLKAASADVDAFLDNLVMTTPAVPSREHIHHTYSAQYAAPALDELGLSSLSPNSAMRQACRLVAEASRERIVDEAWAALLAAPPNRRVAVLADLRLEARRVTSDDLRRTLTGADSHEVPRLHDVDGDAPEETTLTKKLVRGGLGPSVIDSAQRRRRMWFSHVAAVRDLGDREAELRSLKEWVQDQANDAETEAMSEELYGRRMHRDLLGRLRAPDALPPGTRQEDRDPSLLSGAAFELTDHCTVWWSSRFDVDGADAVEPGDAGT